MKGKKHMKINNLSQGIVALTLVSLIGCGGNVGTSASNPSTSSTTFPRGLAVASPFELISASGGSSIIRALALEEGEEIEDALSGDDCDPGLDLSAFATNPTDADCYGPTVSYVDHPDGGLPNDGDLPHGDVGIWSATNEETGEACSAAQLTARMEGAKAKTDAAKKLWAAALCVGETAGSVDDTNMNAMATDKGLDLTFSDVTETKSGDNYALSMTVSDSTISVDLVLSHNGDDEVYDGRVAYAVNTTSDSGNCQALTGSTDVTIAGAAGYSRDADGLNLVSHQDAIFCGADADAVDEATISISADDKYSESNVDGWGATFEIFNAEYNDSLEGSYVYAWQAGANDDNARILNISLEQVVAGMQGQAYFGYGLPVDDDAFDGSIGGFICNWAGPGNDHTLVDSVQSQTITIDTEGNSEATASSIQYAPTVACSYDGGAGFQYDLDGDGTIDADEIADEDDGIESELADIADMVFTLPSVL